jgi:hypothetical protein
MDCIENDTSNNSMVAYILCSRNVSTEPFPSSDRGYIYRHKDWLEGFMNYAVEMGSGSVIYTPSFIKINSSIQKLIGGTHT